MACGESARASLLREPDAPAGVRESGVTPELSRSGEGDWQGTNHWAGNSLGRGPLGRSRVRKPTGSHPDQPGFANWAPSG